MSNLVPEKWRESLEQINDKIGHFLSKLVPWKTEEYSPEQITADTIPAIMQLGGPLLDMHETADELVIRAEVPGLKKDDFSVELVGRRLINGPECSGRRTQFLLRLIKFADETGLCIRIIYYPPYHCKYNSIERYWAELKKSWNG